MSNLIVVTLPTMHFRRAPETRNLFATRRLYIYITTVSFIDSFRLESVSIEGNRATVATLHRLLIPKLTPYPTRDTPLSLYIHIYIHRFVSRQDSRISFSSPSKNQSWKHKLGSRFISFRSNRLFEMFVAPFRKVEKGNEKERKEAKKKRGSHRRRETVRFASWPERIRGCEITR